MINSFLQQGHAYLRKYTICMNLQRDSNEPSFSFYAFLSLPHMCKAKWNYVPSKNP